MHQPKLASKVKFVWDIMLSCEKKKRVSYPDKFEKK